MKIPELWGNWSVLKVRRITWKTKKTSRKKNGKVPPKFLKNILVVRQEKTYGETGGNYLLKPTGNGRHFAGRYSWWTPRQKFPSLTDFYLVTNCFFPVIHELTTWNMGLGTGNTSPSWVSQCLVANCFFFFKCSNFNIFVDFYVLLNSSVNSYLFMIK